MIKLLLLLFVSAISLEAANAPMKGNISGGRSLSSNDVVNIITNLVPSGGSSGVFTNDGTFIYQSGTGPVTADGGPPFLISKNGSFLIGTNVLQDSGIPTTVVNPLYAVSMTRSNEPDTMIVQFAVLSDESYDFYSEFFANIHGTKDSSSTQFGLESVTTNGSDAHIDFSTTAAAPSSVSSTITLYENTLPKVQLGPAGAVTATGVFTGNGSGLTNLSFSTNASPTSVTIGVTAPDRWMKLKDISTGFTWFAPVWTNH